MQKTEDVRGGMMGESIRFGDEFTINNAAGALEAVRSAMHKKGDLEVDLTNVESIDVAAVQVLLAVSKECNKEGKKLVLKESSAVKNILEFTGIRL